LRRAWQASKEALRSHSCCLTAPTTATARRRARRHACHTSAATSEVREFSYRNIQKRSTSASAPRVRRAAPLVVTELHRAAPLRRRRRARLAARCAHARTAHASPAWRRTARAGAGACAHSGAAAFLPRRPHRRELLQHAACAALPASACEAATAAAGANCCAALTHMRECRRKLCSLAPRTCGARAAHARSAGSGDWWAPGSARSSCTRQRAASAHTRQLLLVMQAAASTLLAPRAARGASMPGLPAG
jgi:hypothetical protein